MRTCFVRSVGFGCVFAFVLAHIGCTNQADVGSTHLAVISATPWEEYQHELQPTFKISEDAALELAVPVTSRLDQAIFDAVIARAAVGAGDQGVFPAATTQSLQPANAQPTSRPADAMTAFNAKADALVAVDPFLKHQLATALLQEIKLINRYVADAAVRRNYDAHIVRLQLTNLQRRRDLAVDYYQSIGFFATEPQPPKPKAAARAKDSGTRIISPQAQYELQAQSPGAQLQDDVRRRAYENTQVPLVIPLIVADQIEAAVRSQRVETLRQLALAVTLVFGKVQGSAGLDTTRREIEDALGRDFNSLLTVGRQTENVLRVRVGARRVLGDEYESTTQNHYVTAVVLVPRGYTKLEVVSRGTIANAETGRLYPAMSEGDRDSQLIALMAHELGQGEPWSVLPDVFPGRYRPTRFRLADAASRGQFILFLRELGRIFPLDAEVRNLAYGGSKAAATRPTRTGDVVIDMPTARRLFVAVGSTRLGERYSTASLELRDPNHPEILAALKAPTTMEAALAQDDGSVTKVLVSAPPALANRLLSARMTIPGAVTDLAADKVEARPRQGKVMCEFPTLKPFDLKGQIPNGTITVAVHLLKPAAAGDRTSLFDVVENTPVTYVRIDKKEEARAPAATVTGPADVSVSAFSGAAPAEPTIDVNVAFDVTAAGKPFKLMTENVTLVAARVVKDDGTDGDALSLSADKTGYVVTAGAAQKDPADETMKVPPVRLRLKLNRSELRPAKFVVVKLTTTEKTLVEPKSHTIAVLP